MGRKVVWPVGKHEARGKIVALRGKNGLVRARFRKGVPGQALGTLVEINWLNQTQIAFRLVALMFLSEFSFVEEENKVKLWVRRL